jgi:hypothetical protein
MGKITIAFTYVSHISLLRIYIYIYTIDFTHIVSHFTAVHINSIAILPALEFQYDIYLILCVQFWTPDDGRKDRPKHVEWYSINSKIVHLVGFTVEIYHDARSHERQTYQASQLYQFPPSHVRYIHF